MTGKQDGGYTQLTSTGLSSPSPIIIHSPVAIELCMDDERLHVNLRMPGLITGTSHELTRCVDFTHKLLVDKLSVKQLRNCKKHQGEDSLSELFSRDG